MAFSNMKKVDECDKLTLYFIDRIENDYRPRSSFADGDTVIMEGLPHPIEYVHGQVPHDIGRYVDLQDHVVCKSMEGTSILVFWHIDTWFVSTHKKLDAFKSYWADRNNTFGNSFAMGLAVALKHPIDRVGDHREFVSLMCDKYLDKTKKYIFILPAKYSERIGTRPTSEWPRPRQTVVMDSDFKVLENEKTFPGVYQPDAKASRMTTLLDMVRDVDIDYCQGYYIRRRGHTLQMKIYNAEYYKRMQIRGNMADLKYSYMFCRDSDEKAGFFCDTYQEFDWKTVERDISNTINDILELENGNKNVIPFVYSDFTRILRNARCTHRNLRDLTKTAPVAFNRVMNARKKAHRKHRYLVELEAAKAEEETNQDMFEQMEALEQFEFDIGTRLG